MRKTFLVPVLTFSLALALFLVAPPAASAAEVAGVTMADRVEVDGQSLVLNGMGLREKFFVDVYVAGLYLPAKQRSETAIFGSDTPRRLVMHFVHDVTKDQVCEAWQDSLKGNRPNAPAALAADFDTLCGWMEDVTEGEEMVFTYLPETGTTVTVRGEEKGTIEGKEFADALYASWIGDKPATGKLKKGLLGG